MDDFKKEKHESYGMLQFSRVNGGASSLFGSSIQHNNTIRMRLCNGSVQRRLNTDWYHAGSEIVEVEMSQTQFAELITSMNCGSGVPVTIKHINRKIMENCDFTNKRMQFEEEFAEKMKKISVILGKLTQQSKEVLNDKKTITVVERKAILNKISNLESEISSNIPFMSSCFNEQMDKIVNEAKGEVDAFVLNKITSLGLEKLEELKLLK
jgi:hypothetical protein